MDYLVEEFNNIAPIKIQNELYNDFVNSCKIVQVSKPCMVMQNEKQGQTKNQLIKNLCIIAESLQVWQLIRLIEVLRHAADHETSTTVSNFDHTIQSI